MTENKFNQWINKDDNIINEYQNNSDIFTIGVKDCIETKDFPTTCGTNALENYNGGRDADVIAKLRSDGVKVAGKTNLHELCFGITSNNFNSGAVTNPHNDKYVAGGSSGGNAVAIYLNEICGAVGTDTGGSTRIPASFCGIYGFRPSINRYNNSNVMPLSHTRDTTGPMANSMDNICYMDSVMAGKKGVYGNLTQPNINNIRLGVPDSESLGLMDEDVEKIYNETLEKLKSKGFDLITISLAEIHEMIGVIGFPVVMYEVIRQLPEWLRESNSGIEWDELIDKVKSPDVKGILQSAKNENAIPDDLYNDCQNNVNPKLKIAYKKIMNDNDLDGIVMPTVPVLPPKCGDDETINVQGQVVPTFPTVTANTAISPAVSSPSVSIPMGVGRDNLPVGLMIDGLEDKDEDLLMIAKLIDSVI